MFNFGLFATHIPYVIFAFAYMVYFGANILDHPELLTNPDDSVIIENRGYVTGNSRTAHYCETNNQQQSGTDESVFSGRVTLKHPILIVLQIIHPSNNKPDIIRGLLNSNYISLPPPFFVG